MTGVAEYRSLTSAERGYFESIYGDSLDYDAIRIQRGGVESWVGMDPHVVGNDIYLPDGAFGANGEVVNLPLLAHEAGHVWQFQKRRRGLHQRCAIVLHRRSARGVRLGGSARRVSFPSTT